MPRTGGRRVLLLQAPYSDYTSPYHSLAYVAAPLRHAGYEVDLYDINVLWFRHVFRRETLNHWSEIFKLELDTLNGRPRLDQSAQRRVIELLRAMAACRAIDPERAVRTLQGEAFYNWEAYALARHDVRSFEHLLDFVYPPYSFSRAFAVPPHEPNARHLVDKALSCTALICDFITLLRSLCDGHTYLFCGVSMQFSANLLPGLALLEAVGKVFNGTPRVAGGTAISDIFKYRRSNDTLTAFARVCEFFYVGEAEPQVQHLAAYCEGRALLPSQAVELQNPTTFPRQLAYVALSGGREADRFVRFDWRSHPPWYGWINWDLYLAPERRVLYAPTRGCFWNKCAFCDYGLNEDAPTAPARAMEPEVVVEHLRQIKAQGVDRVYLAADAIAPSFLERFAEELLNGGFQISWSSQLFLTKTFTPDFVYKLQQAGMRMASFGLESGSSRVLELMGKGKNRVDTVLKPVLEAFRRSSIGLQPLFFFGFPGETDDDRQQTVDLLNSYEDVFSPIARGGFFTLLSGSMIAKNPQRYGLRILRNHPEADILWDLHYDNEDGTGRCRGEAFGEYNGQLRLSEAFERPWAGGIDTLHSQLYVERFGRGVFKRLRRLAQVGTPRAHEIDVRFRFDLAQIAQNVLISYGLERGRDAAMSALQVAGIDDLEIQEVLSPLMPLETPTDYRLVTRPYREIWT